MPTETQANDQAAAAPSTDAWTAESQAVLEADMKKRLSAMLEERSDVEADMKKQFFKEMGETGAKMENRLTQEPAEVAQSPTAVEPTPEMVAELIPEQIAQLAYARIAEELKWKGDFPEWDKISSRAQTLYVESVAFIQKGASEIAATGAHIAEQTVLFNENCEKFRTSVRDAAKPRTRFEEFVVEVLAPKQ